MDYTIYMPDIRCFSKWLWGLYIYIPPPLSCKQPPKMLYLEIPKGIHVSVEYWYIDRARDRPVAGGGGGVT